ncbi:MAG: protein-glutamate O-methyltransferase CheR [Methanosarcina sp.]
MSSSSMSSDSVNKASDEGKEPVRVLEVDLGYELLKKIITENTGFNCEHYKEAHFRRRINVRVRATNSDSYGAYLKLLKKVPEEYGHLVETLTVNVSEFFRNPETFEIIEKEIIPSIVKCRSESLIKSIRIWSAGCAAGEETYSLAILLHSILKTDFNKYRIRITGTDIDAQSLEKARRGIYSENSLKNIDASIKEHYFLKQGEEYQVIDQLKNITHFKYHDLISGPKLNHFDIIICRNVMIYFKKEIQEQLQLNFHQALEKGGFFVIGKAETLLGSASCCFKPYNSRERLYMKETL